MDDVRFAIAPYISSDDRTNSRLDRIPHLAVLTQATLYNKQHNKQASRKLKVLFRQQKLHRLCQVN